MLDHSENIKAKRKLIPIYGFTQEIVTTFEKAIERSFSQPCDEELLVLLITLRQSFLGDICNILELDDSIRITERLPKPNDEHITMASRIKQTLIEESNALGGNFQPLMEAIDACQVVVRYCKKIEEKDRALLKEIEHLVQSKYHF